MDEQQERGMKRKIERYTRDELQYATFAYAFIAVFLLVFIRNDFLLIDSRSVLIMILTARGIVTLTLLAVIISTVVQSARDWYEPLHKVAFVTVALLDPLVLLTRPEFTYYNVLPSFLIIALTYFVLPARLSLKIAATTFVSFSGVFLSIRSSSLEPAGALTIPLSYAGLILIGIVHEYRYGRAKRVERAYHQRMADDIKFKQALSDSFWNGIFLVRDGLIVDINQPMEELLGLERSSILGKDASIFYSIDGSESISSPGEGEYNGKLLTGDTQEVPVLLKFRDIEIEGTLCHAVLAEDLTEKILGSLDEGDQLAQISVKTERLPLSRRQKQIVRELMRGLTRRQIAEELFITDDTVKSHISQIYRKLDVNSRVALAKHVLES